MRLHTNLSYAQVYYTLKQAKDAGHVTPDVDLVVFTQHKSRTHPFAFEVQLGTCDKHSLPKGYRDQNGYKMNVRRYKNTGSQGASSKWSQGENLYAATYDEWGWWINAVFTADPTAMFKGGGDYLSPADFERKTKGQFDPAGMEFPKGYGA